MSFLALLSRTLRPWIGSELSGVESQHTVWDLRMITITFRCQLFVGHLMLIRICTAMNL